MISSRQNQHACPLCKSESFRNLYTCFEAFHVVRCRKCRFVYTTLPVNKAVLEELYGEEYYHTGSREQYYFHNCVTDREVAQTNSNIQDFLAGLSLIGEYRSGGKLLDVGCGIGVFLSLAKQQGWDVTGIDVSPFAASYARQTLGVNASAGELEEARFPDAHFDVITLWDVIEHFPDPVHTLREVRRILKDDGVILVDTPNEQSMLKVMARWLYCLSGGMFTYPVQKMYHQWHLSYFTADSLRDLLRRAGFRLQRLDRKSISLMKARGRPWERVVVKLLSWPERLLRRETELIAVATKDD